MKTNNQNSDCSPDNIESDKLGVRPEYTCVFLTSAIAQVSSDVTDRNEEELDNESDPVQEILDEAFVHFAHGDVIESFYDHGVRSSKGNGWKPERFENFNVVAEVWVKVEMTLPFDPSGKLSLSQQQYIHRNAADILSQSIDFGYDPEISEVGLWLTDTDGEPTQFLTGLFEVQEGRLNKRQLKRITSNAWRSIPSELRGPNQAS
jgi:hypothetical protein